MIPAKFEKTFEGWRDEARRLLMLGAAPSSIQWSERSLSLFTDLPVPNQVPPAKLLVPTEFIEMAQAVCYARDEDRWELLYRILYRLHYEDKNLMKISVDSDIHRAEILQKSVRRDIHKMHAFVRFKKTVVEGREVYVAWHKPEHPCVKPGTPFFARRFGDRRWSIFTPDESAHWDLVNLTFGPGMAQSDFVAEDSWEDLWKSYYKSIFNPARIKVKMMKSEMAPKYWSTMPETSLIPQLLREAPLRLQKMAANHNRAATVDATMPLPALREKARSCKACPLFSQATQTIFGVGPDDASMMIVGEQPGDQEDLSGVPFTGPAGDVLTEALRSANIARESLYITNAVKHFKFSREGKLRRHQKPIGSEMHACKPWLEAEINQVKPKVILALGATAATAVLGRLPKINDERGKLIRGLKVAPVVILSWHPAAILRSSSTEEARLRTEQLAQDLGLAARALTALQSDQRSVDSQFTLL